MSPYVSGELLRRHPLLRANHPAELHAIVEQYGGPHRREVLDTGPFRARINVVPLQGGAIAWQGWNRTMRVQAPDGASRYLLQWMLQGRSERHLLGQRARVAREPLSILSPGVAHEVRVEPGCGLYLSLDPSLVNQILAARLGHATIGVPVRFDPRVAPSAALVSTLTRLTAAIVAPARWASWPSDDFDEPSSSSPQRRRPRP